MKKKLRIYVATPVNGRKERTYEEKRKQAYLRCVYLRTVIRDEFPNAEVVTSFDVCPIDEQIEESTAMGRCVSLVMTCDAIWMDGHWNESKGCRLEHRTAELYGLCIMNHGTLK